MEVEEICAQLDQFLILQFTLVEEMQQCRRNLAKAMKDGHWNLAQARHAGAKIGPLHYDMGMRASLSLQVVEPSSSNEENDRFSDESLAESLASLSISEHRPKSEATPSGEIPAQFAKQNSAAGATSDNEELEEERRKVENPLSWYGMLVPPALRQAQKDWTVALHSGVAIANLAFQIQQLQQQIKELQAEKSRRVPVSANAATKGS